ncbi:hypothetical protein [Novipirellula sp.]|uniref:hypothetical protein n=1 Tax=Novipirellula sp. TaxID=2795430 RepID=UPI0035614B4F
MHSIPDPGFRHMEECCRQDLNLPEGCSIAWRNVSHFPSLPGCHFFHISTDSALLEHCSLVWSSSLVVAWNTGREEKRYEFVELRSDGAGLQEVLRERWEFLCHACAKCLASLILDVTAKGSYSHFVLGKGGDVVKFPLSYPSLSDRFEVNFSELNPILPKLGRTRFDFDRDAISLRVLTLLGCNHHKTDLGVERLRIYRDGRFEKRPRQVWSTQIFSATPDVIWD